MTVSNTPAGRLLAIFDDFRSVKKQGTVQQLWSASLGHLEGTSEEVTNMTEMALLLREVELASRKVAESGLDYDEQTLLHAQSKWAAAIFGWGFSLRPDANKYTPTNVLSLDSRQALAATHNLLKAAAREGVLPSDEREERLATVSEVISEVLGQLKSEDGIPEWTRIQLAGKLDDVRETIRNIRFRGDQAVGDKLIAAAESFSSIEPRQDSLDNHTQATTPIQQKIESWSATLRATAQNYYSALAAPVAVSYFLATRDPLGAGLILATQSPGVLQHAAQALLTQADSAAAEGPTST